MKFLLIMTLFFTQLSFAAKNPKVLMKTNMGDIEIELFQDKAPVSVSNFLKYAKANLYNGTVFHRVIDNFMIQGGGFTVDMKRKKTFDPIKNEASNRLSNEVGTLAMARTSDPNSATNQFFINVKHNSFLDYRGASNPGYAVFGRVVKGMTVVNRIKKVSTRANGPHQNMPMKNVIIESIKSL